MENVRKCHECGSKEVKFLTHTGKIPLCENCTVSDIYLNETNFETPNLDELAVKVQ